MSENEILKKLRIKSGHRAIVVNAPESYRPVLAEMPEDVEVAEALEGQFDFIHYFATDRAEVERQAPELKAHMRPGSILWVSYPKGKAIPTDLNRDILRVALEKFGLIGVSQVAIYELWSALRFKLE